MGLVEDFPFTSLLSLVGLLVGSIIGGIGEGIFERYNFLGVGVNPVGFFSTYFSDVIVIVMEGLFVGIIVGLLFGVVGFVIDVVRREY